MYYRAIDAPLPYDDQLFPMGDYDLLKNYVVPSLTAKPLLIPYVKQLLLHCNAQLTLGRWVTKYKQVYAIIYDPEIYTAKMQEYTVCKPHLTADCPRVFKLHIYKHGHPYETADLMIYKHGHPYETADLMIYKHGHPYETADLMIYKHCLLYTSPSPRDLSTSRMPSSA